MNSSINCLSDKKFYNLLFVNVRIQNITAVALFDTGASMTVIAQSLLDKLGDVEENGHLRAGNNNVLTRELHTSVVSDIQIGDICIDALQSLVVEDADFNMTDEWGNVFPAQMLLGWDVISQYAWSYSAEDNHLSVAISEKKAKKSDSGIEHGPLVFPEYCGQQFKAKVDTGHTETILGRCWNNRLENVQFHETDVAGVGSTVRVSVPYVKDFKCLFQNRIIHLHNIDILEKIYGVPEDIEALFGYDFLEGKNWLLDCEFKLS